MDSKPATVTIAVLPPKRPPVANDVTISVPSEKPSPINILVNASDPDGQALTAHIVNGPCHGYLRHNDDGSYTYVPQDEWFGDDSFTYYVNDSEAKSNLATVHIKVVPMPTAQNAQFHVNSDGTISIDLHRLVDDPDENAEALLTISAEAPSHGQLTLKKEGIYLYKPDLGFSGSDTFIYTASDGTHNASATITLDVRRNDDEDDDGCWNSRTIFVSAYAHADDDNNKGSSYIIINQGLQKNVDDEDSTPQLNWRGSGDTDFGATTMIDGDWWNQLISSPIPNTDDLREQSGLVVKRMD